MKLAILDDSGETLDSAILTDVESIAPAEVGSEKRAVAGVINQARRILAARVEPRASRNAHEVACRVAEILGLDPEGCTDVIEEAASFIASEIERGD